MECGPGVTEDPLPAMDRQLDHRLPSTPGRQPAPQLLAFALGIVAFSGPVPHLAPPGSPWSPRTV